jgi:hypothetical protein
MKIGDIKYTPVGNELGYCIGEHIDTHEKHVYYFEGYPDLKYEKCNIVLVNDAHVDTFTSDTIMGEGRDKNHKYFKGKVVKKGTGRILSQDWEFIPGQGIQCDHVVIRFGMSRVDARSLLSNEQEYNYSRGESEDSYKEFQNTSTWFKLSYNGRDLLKEIEFHSGKLRYNKIALFGGDTDVKDLVDQFQSLGFVFRKNEYGEGLLCEELKAVIASAEDMGGDGGKFDYFYTSSDITHLLEG